MILFCVYPCRDLQKFAGSFWFVSVLEPGHCQGEGVVGQASSATPRRTSQSSVLPLTGARISLSYWMLQDVIENTDVVWFFFFYDYYNFLKSILLQLGLYKVASGGDGDTGGAAVADMCVAVFWLIVIFSLQINLYHLNFIVPLNNSQNVSLHMPCCWSYSYISLYFCVKIFPRNLSMNVEILQSLCFRFFFFLFLSLFIFLLAFE